MTFLSVILPVFNCEKYLDRSIKSVLNQTAEEFELIVVDDGSTDASGIIADSYCGKNNCVKVIHKLNTGVTDTRLEGIKEATGKYIAFIDADDWWDEDYIDTYMRRIKDDSLDMIAGGCVVESDSGTSIKVNGIPDGIYDLREDGDFFYSKMLHYEGFFKFGILPYLWNKIFRKDLLLNAYENMDLSITDGEDVALIQMYMAMADKVRVFSEAKYHYMLHPFQKTANKDDFFYENSSRLYLCLKKNMEKYPCFKVFLPQLDQYMRYMIWLKSPESFPKSVMYFQMPFQKIPVNSRIILHGAGNVGKSYHKQIEETGYCRIICWVDKKYEEIRNQGFEMVESPDSIFEKEYDYILIAIADGKIAKKIMTSYIDVGVAPEKIVY